jgi:hypothetical protein
MGVERTDTVSVVVRGSAGTQGLDPTTGSVLWTASDAVEASRRVAGVESVPHRSIESSERWDPPTGPGRVVVGEADLDDEGYAFVLRLPDDDRDEPGARALVDLCRGPERSTPSAQGPSR